MSAKPPTRSSDAASDSPDAPAPLTDGFEARQHALESEIERLRLALGIDGATRRARYRDELRTVKVPEPFQAPFLRAQQYVADYFSDRIEQPDTATILIAGERYVLLRAASLSVEFVELVMKLYQDKGEAEARSVANDLLFDLAHALGKADARSFQKKMGVSDPIDNLSAGPIQFAFSGWAFVDISAESRPSPDENYFLLYDHPFSFESHAWLEKGKKSDIPVCIMNAGYSSGWCEESFGLPLVAVEVECLAAGGEHCRFVMAPPSRIEEHVARHASRTPGAPHIGASRIGVIPEFFQRKRLEAELREANEQLEQRVRTRTQELERANEQLGLLGSAVENAAEGFAVMQFIEGDDPLNITFVNNGFSRITGRSAQSVVGRSFKHLRLLDEQGPAWAELLDKLRRVEPFEAQVTAVRPDGSSYALEFHVFAIRRGADQPTHWIAVLRDISDRKAQLDTLKYQALHDALTGLPNRVLLHERIEQGIVHSRQQGKHFALLFLDMDGFKDVNDTFGHQVGDRLLTLVGSRLQMRLGPADTIARLGGDEFAIVLSALDQAADAERFGAKLLQAFDEPFIVEEHTLVVSASIGVAHWPEHGVDPSMLMRRADVAMYAAKAAQSGVMSYEPRQDRYSPLRTQLIAELRSGIDKQQLELHYQPQLDLVTGKVVRAEALLRWNRADGR